MMASRNYYNFYLSRTKSMEQVQDQFEQVPIQTCDSLILNPVRERSQPQEPQEFTQELKPQIPKMFEECKPQEPQKVDKCSQDHVKYNQLRANAKLKWIDHKCLQGNNVKRICVYVKCKKAAFTCGLQTCKTCHGSHEECQTVEFGAFRNRINRMTDYQSSFFKKIFEVDQRIIESILQNEKKMVQTVEEGSLDENFKKILRVIAGKQDLQNFNGKEAKVLLDELKEKQLVRNKNEDILEQIFSEMSDRMIKQNLELKQQVYDKFIKRSEIEVPQVEKPPFIDSPLLRLGINDQFMNTPQAITNQFYMNYQYFSFPNKEKKAFDNEYYQYLRSQLKYPVGSKLLYKATKQQFSVQRFHQLCDGCSDTLTIIRTEFGRTIIAYAHPAWHQSGEPIKDNDNRSCLLLLNNKKSARKMSCQDCEQAIVGDSAYGPIFGERDIRIGDHAQLYTQFPSVYNDSDKQVQKGGGNTMMTGNPQNINCCKILDYEVYQLYFDEQQQIKQAEIE